MLWLVASGVMIIFGIFPGLVIWMAETTGVNYLTIVVAALFLFRVNHRDALRDGDLPPGRRDPPACPAIIAFTGAVGPRPRPAARPDAASPGDRRAGGADKRPEGGKNASG